MKGQNRIKKQIAIVVAFCLLFSSITWWDVKQVYAETTATVYKIYATFPAESEQGGPSAFEIANEKPNEKELFGLLIDGGDYALEDGEEELFITVNNANVTVPTGKELCDYRLSGDSTIKMDTYTIKSSKDVFTAFDTASGNLDGEKVVSFYTSEIYEGNGKEGEAWVGPKPYSYEITSDMSFSGWKDMDSLIVNKDVTLTIPVGSDENKNSYWHNEINAKSVIVNGTIQIGATNEKCSEPNHLAIEGGGSLCVAEGGAITGAGDAVFEIRENASVSGLDLYEQNSENPAELVQYKLGATHGTEFFSFDANSNWVRQQPNDSWSGIRIDTRGATVQYKVENDTFNQLPEDGTISRDAFETASSVTLQITSNGEPQIKGLKIRKFINNGESLSYQQLPESNTYTLEKDEEGWADYEIEIIDRDVLFDNQYRIFQRGGGELGLKVNNTETEWNTLQSFSANEAINFSFTENVYKVIVCQNDQETKELTGVSGVYTFTPESALGFEVQVYSSEEQYNYDYCQPNYDNGEFQIEYQFSREENDGQSSVTYDVTPIASASCDGWTKLILASNVEQVKLTISAAEGYHYEISGQDTSNDNVYVWDVSTEEGKNWRPEIRFISDSSNSGGGNQGGDNTPQVKDIIENQRYAFGDWDEDNDVDEADLKLGMACQIFYPRFSQNPSLQEAYNITSYNSLIDKITLTKNESKNLLATDATGTAQTIPAYDYEITLTPADSTNYETVNASGTVYAFSFASDSNYGKNSRGCVIAVTKKNGVESYHLRCAQGTNTDTVQLAFGASDNKDSAIVIVDDFDVTYDSARGEYQRGVSIFGNGASLDALFSQEEDRGLVAYQGRNEDFMRDVNGALSRNWNCIFGIFTFCQKDFTGVRVKGSGAQGNTPSWAFNQYPIYSTASNTTSSNEAVVYFGNRTVTIEPVGNLSELNKKVTGIQSVTTVDAIPEAALEIKKETDVKWTLYFKSDFYDNVKVKIVYSLEGGGTLESYINIHRVGIDILCGDAGGGNSNMTLFHGTENGPSYTPKGNFVIWGTYYYPTQADGNKLVDLYVTYTWADGSVTRETIKNNASLNLAYQHNNTNDCQSSDFILYDGERQNAPVKIEAIAVALGFEDAATFSGAKFGAGKGVVWNNYYKN